MYTDLEEMARRLQSKEYDILELRSQVQLKGLEIADLERKLKVGHLCPSCLLRGRIVTDYIWLFKIFNKTVYSLALLTPTIR